MRENAREICLTSELMTSTGVAHSEDRTVSLQVGAEAMSPTNRERRPYRCSSPPLVMGEGGKRGLRELNDHLRVVASAPTPGRRAWPDRLRSNRAGAIAATSYAKPVEAKRVVGRNRR